MSCSPPHMAYLPLVIPYPGTPGAPFFDGQNITHFLDLFDQLCSDYHLSESEKIYRLPWYCEFLMGKYIKVLIKGADWATVRSILRKEYKNNDLDQLMNSREFFLEALKKSPGLPERVVMEIFYQYDIDLEDDDGLDFGDLLEKALVLVKRRKYLADFVRNKETDLVNKYTDPQEKVSTTPNIAEPFTYPAQDLAPPTRFQTVQGPIQEDIPVVRIHTSRVEEVKAGELSLGADDCILISDPAEDFFEDLGALFTNLKPGDEKVVQLHLDSVTIVEPFDDTIGIGRYTHRPDTSNKRTAWKFMNSLDAGIDARKKAGMISEEGFARFDGIAAGRGVIKSEDHG